MKPKPTLRAFLLGCSSLLAASSLHAAPLYWDATPGTPDGASNGGTGTWDTVTANWDDGALYQVWNNVTNASDTAVFAGSTGTITMEAGGITAGALDITGGYTFTGGAITAAGGLTKAGGGTMQILNNNSISGNIVISGGELQLGSNNNTGSLNGGSFPGDISIASGSTFRDRSNNSVTMSGVISGDGNLHQDGGGTMTLTGDNTYTGQTIIRASGGGGPTLSVSSLNSVTTPAQQLSSSLGVPVDAAAGTIVLGSGTNVRSCTLIYTGAGETTDRVMNVSFNSGADQEIRNTGGGLLKFTEPFTINRSSGNSGGRFTLGGSGDGEVEGGMTGGIIPGDLWKDDAGTWTLGGTTTVDDLRVAAGTLVIDVGGTLDATDSDPDGTGVVTATGGTLTVNGSLDFVSTTISGATVDGTGSLSFDIDGTSSDLITMTSGTLTGTGLTVAVVPGVNFGGLTETEYVLVDSTGGGTFTGPFAGLTGAPGYELNYDTPNQVKLVQTGGGSAYDTWAGGAVFTDDDNGDGVTNGVAFLLGAVDPDEIVTDRLPTVTESGGGLIMTFNCLPVAARGTATLSVEHSSDLGVLDAWLGALVPDTTGGPTNDISFVVGAGPVGPPALNSVTATIDSAAAAGGKLFGRLSATE